MDSSRSMKNRIWRGLLCATDQEIADGLAFYPGAHGLCRLFSAMHPDVSTRHVAGIYAALSPLNTWDTNVANILDVLRDWSAASVNTTDTNLHKALRIRCGEDPETVLVGPKVRAFYRAIADPDDTLPIAIDRHLINLALGIIPSKSEQSDLASDRELYKRIESVYVDLGKREGLGNRLAAIAWFVQRRIARDGQLPILRPSDVMCCGKEMSRHGKPNKQNPTQRYRCRRCGRTSTGVEHQVCLRVYRNSAGDWELGYSSEGFRVRTDSHGRKRITLPPEHPYAVSNGHQTLARFLMSEHLGRPLRSDEHTHHIDGDLTNDSIDNLELVSVEFHGKIHASAMFVGRAEDGRFKELDPSEVQAGSWPRFGPVLGKRAKELGL